MQQWKFWRKIINTTDYRIILVLEKTYQCLREELKHINA